MGLFSKTEKTKKIALFDIGSASIGGAIVSYSSKENTLPVIEYSTRSYFSLPEVFSFNDFVLEMEKCLKACSASLATSGIKDIEDVVCVLGSPWYASQTRTILLKKETPFVFTEKILSEMVEKEVHNFMSREWPKYAGYQEFEIVENYTIDSVLNGYTVTAPFGKKTKDVSVSVFLSLSPKDILDHIKKIVEKSFSLSGRHIHFSTSVFAEYILVRDLFVHHEDCLIVDVDGEITDVSLIRQSVIVETSSFPYGYHNVIRSIKQKINRSFEESESLFKVYMTGLMDQHTLPIVKQSIEDSQKEWISSFEKTLASLGEHFSLPRLIFLTTEGESALWFADAIKREEFSQYTLLDRRFSVIPIANPTINEFCTFGEKVKKKDYDIMMLSVIVGRSHNYFSL